MLRLRKSPEVKEFDATIEDANLAIDRAGRLDPGFMNIARRTELRTALASLVLPNIRAGYADVVASEHFGDPLAYFPSSALRHLKRIREQPSGQEYNTPPGSTMYLFRIELLLGEVDKFYPMYIGQEKYQPNRLRETPGGSLLHELTHKAQHFRTPTSRLLLPTPPDTEILGTLGTLADDSLATRACCEAEAYRVSRSAWKETPYEAEHEALIKLLHQQKDKPVTASPYAVVNYLTETGELSADHPPSPQLQQELIGYNIINTDTFYGNRPT
jgi:hypothetical protein